MQRDATLADIGWRTKGRRLANDLEICCVIWPFRHKYALNTAAGNYEKQPVREGVNVG